MKQDFSAAIDLIRASRRILLVSHRRPDGDTLGANIGLYLALHEWGKQTTLACIDEIPKRLKFLPETDKFCREFDLNNFDLIIICDAGAHHMTGFHERYPDFLSKKVPILNIDHHASNEGFGTVNVIDSHASSATMIVYNLLKFAGLKITADIGTALLAGIYNDTGSFMHSNTTQETFQIASELCRAGAQVTPIIRPMFKESSFSQLKLWGFALENMHQNEKGVVASVISQADLKTLKANSGDTGGIIDLMSTVPNAAFTLLLTEDGGMVKGSLRTQRDDINVSDIAGQFGGGGHKKASGFRIHGHIEQQRVWRIVPTDSFSKVPSV